MAHTAGLEFTKARIFHRRQPIEVTVPKSVLVVRFKRQETKIVGTRRYTLNIRYDDSCGNGHNSFAMTCDEEVRRGDRWVLEACGMNHDMAPLLDRRAVALYRQHFVPSGRRQARLRALHCHLAGGIARRPDQGKATRAPSGIAS